MSDAEEKFLQYGVSSTLAKKASKAGITLTSVRAVSIKDLIGRFGLTEIEAKALRGMVRRKPIEPHIIQLLLESSNFVCAVCKGQKGRAYVIHHITPYEETQDNTYDNLIVLCPTDHDLAHQTGLTLRITPDQLQKAKRNWERQVEVNNVQRAAQAVQIRESSVVYINVRRIEELCLRLFGKIPPTEGAASLKRQGILNADGHFDERYVREHLSNGNYLFDYMNAGETYYYSELMRRIATKINFTDLSDAVDHGKKATLATQNAYAFFIGGVTSKGMEFPVTKRSPLIKMRYKKRNISVEWAVDPNFVTSTTSFNSLSGKNHLIIYGFVKGVVHSADGKTLLVSAQPLLVAHPLVSINKRPAIAYIKERESWANDEGVIDI